MHHPYIKFHFPTEDVHGVGEWIDYAHKDGWF